MLKRSITYTNLFTDETVTEEHYFHISKADLVQMEMEEHKNVYTGKDGKEYSGMQARLTKMVDAEDGKAIIAEIKDLIRRSYGRKDGDRFIKTKEVWDEFSSTEAFSQLLFDLTTDAAQAADFINGIFPKNMDQIASEVRERAERAIEQQPQLQVKTAPMVESEANGAPTEKDPTGLIEDTTPRILSTQEVTEMDSDELKSGLATGRYKLA